MRAYTALALVAHVVIGHPTPEHALESLLPMEGAARHPDGRVSEAEAPARPHIAGATVLRFGGLAKAAGGGKKAAGGARKTRSTQPPKATAPKKKTRSKEPRPNQKKEKKRQEKQEEDLQKRPSPPPPPSAAAAASAAAAGAPVTLGGSAAAVSRTQGASVSGTSITVADDTSFSMASTVLGQFGAGNFTVSATVRATGDTPFPDGSSGTLFVRTGASDSATSVEGPKAQLFADGGVRFQMKNEDACRCDTAVSTDAPICVWGYTNTLLFRRNGTILTISVNGTEVCRHTSTECTIDPTQFTTSVMYFGRSHADAATENLNFQIGPVALSSPASRAASSAAVQASTYPPPPSPSPPPDPKRDTGRANSYDAVEGGRHSRKVDRLEPLQPLGAVTDDNPTEGNTRSRRREDAANLRGGLRDVDNEDRQRTRGRLRRGFKLGDDDDDDGS